MSIIERALNRQRAAQVAEKGPTAVPAGVAARAADTNGAGLHDSTELPSLDLTLERLEAAGLIAPSELRGRHTHEYRVIKRALLDVVRRAGESRATLANLVMVTSALAGEGKTYTSFNLARSLALELDRRVILVDADVPKRDITRAFGLDQAPGLLDLVRDEKLAPKDVLHPTSLGLSFLPAGKKDEHATELISSNRMAEIAHRLGGPDGRNLVVFDSSPLLLTSEAQALVRFVGQVIVVVRAAVTPQEAVRDVIARVDSSKQVSAVLNGWEPSGALEKRYQLGYYYGDVGVDASQPSREKP